jgi:thiol-disulfide isomerase/thioredoxin
MKLIVKLVIFLSIIVLQPILAKDSTFTFELKGEGERTLHIKSTPEGFNIKEYEGKVVLLNFFGKNCKYCMYEIPHLVKLQKKYKGKLQIVAIHAQQRITSNERAKLENIFHFNYPIYEYSDNVDFVLYIARKYNWDTLLPYSILIDKKGKVIGFGDNYEVVSGYIESSRLEKVINRAIKK